ncbi:MAG: ThiF family adenylyltransferase [Desulfobacterales bacterium]|nr:ThiF family adenylyltransferase [Desulfobacterales bacterium]
MDATTIPDSLVKAKQALNGLENIQLQSDWQRFDGKKSWIVKCRLRRSGPSSSIVPQETEWYVAVEPNYPAGTITFYPSKENSITATFPHQMFNGSIESNYPWREGHICLVTGRAILKRHGDNPEPLSANDRLHWHFLRALDWLKKASKNELTKKDDPFEIPNFPRGANEPLIVFNEDEVSMAFWKKSNQKYGLLKLSNLKKHKEVFVVSEFQDISSNTLFKPRWGECTEEIQKPISTALWLKLDKIPVIDPWQAPLMWKELFEICSKQGINLSYILSKLFPKIRDGAFHIVLVGFPISEKIGGENKRIFWMPLLLPALSKKGDIQNKLLQNEAGYFGRDRNQIISDDQKIAWLYCENWEREQLFSRGAFCEELKSKSFLLIGLGTVGSHVAEYLARGGVENITLIDSDDLTAGNLTRHILLLENVTKKKSVCVADRLRSINPFIRVSSHPYSFPLKDDLLKDVDVIIDCTASNDVLHYLDQADTGKGALLITLSISMGAKRLYMYSCFMKKYTAKDYFDEMQYWFRKDHEEFQHLELPREGVGCWHPVFPALGVDVVLLVANAVKLIVNQIVAKKDSGLLVIERGSDLGDVLVHTMETIEFQSRDKKFGLKIRASDYERILNLCAKADHKETGGILVGYYTEKQDFACVTDLSGPPKDSICGISWFYRGIKNLQKWLNVLWRDKRAFYLGEWHYHHHASPYPSDPDIKQTIQNAKNSSYRCPEPLLLIVGGSKQQGFSCSLHVVNGEGVKVELLRR